MTPREEAIRYVADWWYGQLTRVRGLGEPEIADPRRSFGPIGLEFRDLLITAGNVKFLELEATPPPGAFGKRARQQPRELMWVVTWPGSELLTAIGGAGIIPNVALFPLGIESVVTEAYGTAGTLTATTRRWAGDKIETKQFGP